MNEVGMASCALVIGGSSGLGLSLARQLKKEGYDVFITGRHDPSEEGFTYFALDIGEDAQKASSDLDDILAKIARPVDLLVYAAGFFERGTLGELDEAHIAATVNVGVTAPAFAVAKLLRTQSQKLPGVILITSTTQWVPRAKEPVYAATKAGLGMLGDSLALDPGVGKVLIVGPAGLDTGFWPKGEDRSGVLLQPEWVADEVLKTWKDSFKYRLVRILRDPPRVEIVETR